MTFTSVAFGEQRHWTHKECGFVTISKYRPEKCESCGAVPEPFVCPDCGGPAKLKFDSPLGTQYECEKIGCGEYDMDIEEQCGPMPESEEDAA